jgi:hypothetical protein
MCLHHTTDDSLVILMTDPSATLNIPAPSQNYSHVNSNFVPALTREHAGAALYFWLKAG